jgi:hypothetical protein
LYFSKNKIKIVEGFFFPDERRRRKPAATTTASVIFRVEKTRNLRGRKKKNVNESVGSSSFHPSRVGASKERDPLDSWSIGYDFGIQQPYPAVS